MNTIVCLKWGTLYDSDYVNILYAMVKRNLTIPFRFVCFTDDPVGIHYDIDVFPVPQHLKGWWGKIYYFSSPLKDITGTVLALDLDIVIIDNIDCLFKYQPNNFIMKSDYTAHGYSSVVMRFTANQHPHIYNSLQLHKIDHAINSYDSKRFKRKKYWGDQIWITEQMENDPNQTQVITWPEEWILKYHTDCYREIESKKVYSTIKYQDRKQGEFFVPDGAKIIVFAGYSSNNKRHYHDVRRWWHSEDIDMKDQIRTKPREYRSYIQTEPIKQDTQGDLPKKDPLRCKQYLAQHKEHLRLKQRRKKHKLVSREQKFTDRINHDLPHRIHKKGTHISQLKIAIHGEYDVDHHKVHVEHFITGLYRHGFTNVMFYPNYNPVDCDLAVFWGLRRTQKIRENQEAKGNDWLLMERGFVGNRFQFMAIGYNGLNGRGNFYNQNCPSDRWDKYFSDYLLPYHDGEYILLTGQVEDDSATEDIDFTYQDIVEEIRKYSHLPIYYRKHPHVQTGRYSKTPTHCITCPYETLSEALNHAKVCVTINSNSGVDAIIAGTPVINLDCGSMVWDIAEHEFTRINSPPFPDRDQWAYNIAYAQWTEQELKDGDTWDHLKQRYM